MLFVSAKDRSAVYLPDVLDLLERLPNTNQTPYLVKLRDEVERRLQDPGKVPQPVAVDGPTDDKAIDEIRGLIAAAQWGRALNRLESIEADGTGADARKYALALLYRGVALSESGFKGEQEAGDCFRSAILRLQETNSPADRYRAHVNYAGFQANCALDRLQNQPFQAAAGVSHPLVSALGAWSEAADQYGQALEIAGKLGDPERMAAHANLARLHAILADILMSLGSDQGSKVPLPAIEAAQKTARRHARAITDAKNVDPVVRALAESILGQLALREGNLSECRNHADQSLQAYLGAGCIPGLESAHRLLGLAFREEKRGDCQRSALRHLQVAWELGELLRERYPAGQAGSSRAGFFARRAPLADLLVELLLNDGKATEALAYIERARARSLQDLLSSAGLSATAAHLTRELSQVLAAWPNDVVALEYYLGAERAWVFVVEAPGRVRAFPLIDGKGKSVASAQLIQQIRRFIQGLDHLLEREQQRVLSRQYDNGWQEDLHDLYRILIPPEAAAALGRCKVAVVVPQHLLHYLPFAALVTEPDRRRDGSEVACPRFLVEEPFAIVTSPSLVLWDRLRQTAPSLIQDVRAIGDAGASGLAGVAEDLANLKSAFGSRVKAIYTGKAAQKANAKAMLAARGLAFVGSHGQERPDRPLEGHLVFQALSPGKDDGHLTAAEVYAQPVASDMVVMSACYSGRADRSPLSGDDLFGLQRALMQSGARTVIAGLWDVYDGKAPELMNGVFQRMINGEPAAAALAGAQRDFIKKQRGRPEPYRYFTHPYFWAVYSVCGDDRTALKPE
jgi:CHAT domain-containing protein